jgi:hypothetical protein
MAEVIAPGCDLESPSDGAQRQRVDALRMNQIQVLGTHNSYKKAIAPVEMARIRAANPAGADALDYSHPPLTQQLEAGARAIELDLISDPEGGRFADPLGLRLAALAGTPSEPYDAEAMKKPGLKVLHIQDWDYRSQCALFVDGLRELRLWSQRHRHHVPILITMNLRQSHVKVRGAATALPFDAKALDGVDAEIRSVFSAAELITPDDVRGAYQSLRHAALDHAWPTLGEARGRFLFVMDETEALAQVYRGARRSLEERVLFPNVDESSVMAGYITLNEPIEQQARIRAAVAAGYLVRTRTDAETREARANDTARREASFVSGAHYVSTDYMRPDPRFSDYQVSLPGGRVARPNPVTAAVS